MVIDPERQELKEEVLMLEKSSTQPRGILVSAARTCLFRNGVMGTYSSLL